MTAPKKTAKKSVKKHKRNPLIAGMAEGIAEELAAALVSPIETGLLAASHYGDKAVADATNRVTRVIVERLGIRVSKDIKESIRMEIMQAITGAIPSFSEAAAKRG